MFRHADTPKHYLHYIKHKQQILSMRIDSYGWSSRPPYLSALSTPPLRVIVLPFKQACVSLSLQIRSKSYFHRSQLYKADLNSNFCASRRADLTDPCSELIVTWLNLNEFITLCIESNTHYIYIYIYTKFCQTQLRIRVWVTETCFDLQSHHQADSRTMKFLYKFAARILDPRWRSHFVNKFRGSWISLMMTL
jgi:hypothetical protein